jgi:hypothetical protein
MFSWLKSLRGRWAERRAERRATRGERTIRQNEAKELRLRYERMHDKDPMSPKL